MKLASLAAVLCILLLAAAPTARADNLSDARKFLDRDMPFAAAEKLTAATEKNKENHKAWALLAECRLKLQDLEPAYNAAYTALDISKDENADYWKLLGRVAFARGEAAYLAKAQSSEIKLWYADAEAKFKQALARKPDDPDLRWLLGYAKEWQEYPKKALAFYEEQIQKFPKVPDGYLRLGAMVAGDATRIDEGMSDQAKAKRAEAIKLFEEGLDKVGPHGDLLFNLGMAHEWNRARDLAKECYFKALRADTECNKAWKRLFEAYRVPAADLLPVAMEILKKHPKSPTVSVWAGFMLIGQNRSEEALAVLLPTLEKHGEAGGVYTQAFRAAMAILPRKPDAGIAALEKIHEYYPFGGSIANNLGLHYRDRRRPGPDYRKSLEWYLKAMEREPENQDILNDTALIYLFHTTGAEQKKCLPIFLKVVSLVQDDGRQPLRGYWDALENLSKYYWDVERKPKLVIQYADMRAKTTMGVKPYAPPSTALHFKKLAEQALRK